MSIRVQQIQGYTCALLTLTQGIENMKYLSVDRHTCMNYWYATNKDGQVRD